jgi:methionine salvage enolase-phosphatase E1
MKGILAMNISMYFGDVAIWPDATSAVILKRWSLKQIRPLLRSTGHVNHQDLAQRSSSSLQLSHNFTSILAV